MPGYVIHLTEAKIIYDILKKNSQIKNKTMDTWKKDFFYGSLLPDVGGKLQKQNSHFWNESESGHVIMAPDINKFLKKYGVVLNQSPLFWGYLVHLYLDREFWKYYIKENIEFLDYNGKPTEYSNDLKSVFIKKINKKISPEEFFSKDYLYGDYTKLNKVMIHKYHLEMPVYNKCYSNKIEEVDNEEMKRVLENLKMHIANSQIYATDLTVLSLDTLERFLQESAQAFIDLYNTDLVRGIEIYE